MLRYFNVLEALRAADKPPPLVFTSTNKVYGALKDIALNSESGIYYPTNMTVRANGIDELRPLDLHSIDYGRTFGLPAVAFRVSCIFGPRQMGNEDQGWVVHFLIRALEGQTITLYDDGKQVGDVLYVDDLVDVFSLTRAKMPRIAGQAATSIEGAGAQASLDLATALTGEYSRLIIAGYHQDGPRQVNMQLWNWRAIDVINAHEHNAATSTHFMREAAALIECDALDPSIPYTHSFAIDLERRPEGS